MIDELLAKSNGLSDQKIGQSKDGPRDRRITYTAAGVDIEKGDRLVDIVKVRIPISMCNILATACSRCI